MIKSNYKTHRPEYRTWISMRVRCYNPTARGYKYYGGKGITVCPEWLDSFETFFKDMGERPSRDHQIDRINSNKGYYPENCRWISGLQNRRNRKDGIGGEENASIIKSLLILGVSREKISELTGFNKSTIRDLEIEKTFKGVKPLAGKEEYDEKLFDAGWNKGYDNAMRQKNYIKKEIKKSE